MPCFKSIIFFINIALKLSYFCKKIQKFRVLGAPPPDPVPPAAGGFAPRPPSSGGWGLRPQTHKTAPQCEFLVTPLLSVLVRYARILPTSIRTAFSIYYLHLLQHTSARAAFQLLYISKTKARNQREVKDDIRLALSSTKPRIPKLALWLQSLPSH